MPQTAFNPGAGPLTVDVEGHTIGGGEWGEVDLADPVTQELLKVQLLIVPGPVGAEPEPKPEADPERQLPEEAAETAETKTAKKTTTKSSNK